MRAVRVGSCDPSLTNFGLARLIIRTSDLAIGVEQIRLSETEKRKGKVVRQNSDDIRRAQEHLKVFREMMAGCTVCFAEVPVGSQSARAMCSYGVCVGLLAACPIPLIQVQPTETKLATVGTKTASKEEMIEWAVENYPKLPWFKTTRKGVTKYSDKNEHIADAIAAAHAGVRTDQFQQLLAMWRSTTPAVAA